MITRQWNYRDPSAAHEKALEEERKGAYKVVITAKNKRYTVTASWKSAPNTKTLFGRKYAVWRKV